VLRPIILLWMSAMASGWCQLKPAATLVLTMKASPEAWSQPHTDKQLLEFPVYYRTGVIASSGSRRDRHLEHSLCMQIQAYDRTGSYDIMACPPRTPVVGAEANRPPTTYRGRWRRLRY